MKKLGSNFLSFNLVTYIFYIEWRALDIDLIGCNQYLVIFKSPSSRRTLSLWSILQRGYITPFNVTKHPSGMTAVVVRKMNITGGHSWQVQ